MSRCDGIAAAGYEGTELGPYGYLPTDPIRLAMRWKFRSPGQDGFAFGTDNFGRSLWSRVVWGAQLSLYIGFSVVALNAIFGTLIADEDGVYDPAHFNDRLLLGLKGTMSEAELHVLRARLRGGLLNKARRGELEVRLPIGFVYDAQQRVRLDPDARIQESSASSFAPSVAPVRPPPRSRRSASKG